MNKRFVVLALVLLPIRAGAQGLPRAVPLPGTAAVRVAGPSITVSAQGSTRIAVKTVYFAAYARGQADESSVLAAMRAAGIDDPVIGPPGPQIGGNQTMLRGTIRDVSRAKLDRMALAAAAYQRLHPGATIDNINFSPRLDDCAAAEQMARTAALRDARRKAEAIAALSELTVDGVLAVNEQGGCLPQSAESAVRNTFGGGDLDLATLSAGVLLNEQVTFSVVAGAASTKRRTL